MRARVWTPPRLSGRVWLAAGVAIVVVGLSHLIDRAAWHALYDDDIERHDWYQMLRAMGYMPVWLVVGAAMLGVGWTRRVSKRPGSSEGGRSRGGWWRGGVGVAGSAVAAGVAAEGLKLLVGRERPAVIGEAGREFQGFVFKAWDPSAGSFGGLTDSGNLGFPSSHTAVAVAGAVAVARVCPGAFWPLVLTAGGCGLTRLVHGAHFLSDVLAGAALGYALAWLVVRPADLAGCGAEAVEATVEPTGEPASEGASSG
ncbi:MAG: phosphatase PAP2 family protein [Planctomycetota bacterium]